MRDADAQLWIDETGAVNVAPSASEELRRSAGAFCLLPPTERLIIWERVADPQARERGRVVLAGAIDRAGGLVDIMQFIHQNQWTGRLVVFTAAGRTRVLKTVHFRRGDVSAATSNVAEDRIGAILYRFGMITAAELEKALSACGPTTRLGQMLVEQNVLTAHDLFTYIRKQVEEIFFSVLTVGDGEFYFHRAASEDEGVPSQIKLSARELLFEGVSRIDELSYFREKLPPDVVLVRREVSRAQSDPSKRTRGSEQRLLELIDGVRTLAELARESHLGEFEATKIAYQLLQAGVVQRQAPSAKLEELLATFNEVYAKIFAAVSGRGAESSLLGGVRTFLGSEDESGPLFQGVSLKPDGTLPTDQILANLHREPIDEKAEYLRHWLNELLFFEIFFAGEAIDRRETAFHHELGQILREVDPLR